MKHLILLILLLPFLIFGVGCNSTGLQYTSDYAQGSMTGRELFNQRAMDLAEKQSETAVVDFEMSHSAAAAIAATEPETDSEGNPIPAFKFSYTPRVAYPVYVEAPFWRLVPTGGELISGAIAGGALYSSYNTNRRQINASTEIQLRQIDSQDTLNQSLFELLTPLGETAP